MMANTDLSYASSSSSSVASKPNDEGVCFMSISIGDDSDDTDLMNLERDSPAYINVSKLVVNGLRHKAVEQELSIGEDGYVNVDELIAHPHYKPLRLTRVFIKKLAGQDEKQRFQVVQRGFSNDTNDGLYIRATQGHSIPIVRDDLLLTRILVASELPKCMHGTYRTRLPGILESGLSRMELNHIHMSPILPENINPFSGGDITPGVLSGMRSNSEIVIEIDVEQAMDAGIQFYRSLNGVILSRGLGDNGCIPARFFKSVRDRMKDVEN
jgi:2'-phosphotransferase